MSSSKISGLYHPVRSQFGSSTISLACCEVKVVDMEGAYRVSRLTGVTVSGLSVVCSMSMGLVVGLDSFRGEIVGEFLASLLLGLLTWVKGAF